MSGGAGRERWGSKLGLVLAVAGNAVGLGNFLRFPVKASQNGGGAFMIPYFLALLFLAVPLMWMEWAMGRFGGARGHGTTPGIFDKMWQNPISKYLGVMGIFLPLMVVVYYVYIESWTLGFAAYATTGATGAHGFLADYKAVLPPWSDVELQVSPAYLFFIGTVVINILVMYRGISKGIELLAKIAMPLLFLFAIVLVVRIFTMDAPNPAAPENNVWNGLGFIWNPDFSKLGNGTIWLEATGQVFFTLSIGFGAIHTYASYLREKDDVALTGLTTAATNEFAEVVLGGSIAIPIAFAFFGAAATVEIAQGGAFDLGFRALPQIFTQMPAGELFGTLWFLLLFFAGITSSVALTQPMVAFLQDELGLSRRRSVILVWVFIFLAAHLCIFSGPFLDELDNWAGTVGVVVFAAMEALIFCFIYGMKRGWHQINLGAEIKIPGFFKYIIFGITPAYLVVLLFMVGFQGGGDIVQMNDLKKRVATNAVVKVFAAAKLKPGPATKRLLKEGDVTETDWSRMRTILDADQVPAVVRGEVRAKLTTEMKSFRKARYWRWIARYFMIACFIGLAVLVGMAWRRREERAAA